MAGFLLFMGSMILLGFAFLAMMFLFCIFFIRNHGIPRDDAIFPSFLAALLVSAIIMVIVGWCLKS